MTKKTNTAAVNADDLTADDIKKMAAAKAKQEAAEAEAAKEAEALAKVASIDSVLAETIDMVNGASAVTNWLTIGAALMQIKDICPSDKMRKKALQDYAPNLLSIDSPVRSDALWVAENIGEVRSVLGEDEQCWGVANPQSVRTKYRKVLKANHADSDEGKAEAAEKEAEAAAVAEKEEADKTAAFEQYMAKCKKMNAQKRLAEIEYLLKVAFLEGRAIVANDLIEDFTELKVAA